MPAATSPPLSNPPDLSQKLPRLTPRQRPAKSNSTRQPSKNPPIPTPALTEPPALDSLTFLHPTRRILSQHDHDLFLSSPTHTLITSFALTLSDSVRNVPISAVRAQHEQSPDPTIASVLSILSAATSLLENHPPDHESGSRFGNPVFRSYLSAVSSNLPSWHTTHLSASAALPVDALDELTTYLHASLGSASRIDYGSGHELHFLIYLLSLHRLSLLPAAAFPAAVCLLLPAYLALMRALQSTYYLEPAGSHGVWGLDDYHFLPFLFGAAQLADHAFITPLGIHTDALLDAYADDYLYLDMVRHVNATKTVKGLRWHSPMLDDISGTKSGWGKVEQGMRRMLEGEVLGKLVVMQHFLFGGLVAAVEGMTVEKGGEGVGGDHEGHTHLLGQKAESWDDCCGIRVPSSVGAAQEMRRKGMAGQELRRLPFD